MGRGNTRGCGEEMGDEVIVIEEENVDAAVNEKAAGRAVVAEEHDDLEEGAMELALVAAYDEQQAMDATHVQHLEGQNKSFTQLLLGAWDDFPLDHAVFSGVSPEIPAAAALVHRQPEISTRVGDVDIDALLMEHELML